MIYMKYQALLSCWEWQQNLQMLQVLGSAICKMGDSSQSFPSHILSQEWSPNMWAYSIFSLLSKQILETVYTILEKALCGTHIRLFWILGQRFRRFEERVYAK